jgi:hypothetical protein
MQRLLRLKKKLLLRPLLRVLPLQAQLPQLRRLQPLLEQQRLWKHITDLVISEPFVEFRRSLDISFT